MKPRKTNKNVIVSLFVLLILFFLVYYLASLMSLKPVE